MDDGDYVLTGQRLCRALMEAFGIDKKQMVTRIVVDADCNFGKVASATVYRVVTKSEAAKLAEAVRGIEVQFVDEVIGEKPRPTIRDIWSEMQHRIFDLREPPEVIESWLKTVLEGRD